MDRNAIFLGDSREAMSEARTLDPQCFAELRAAGQFVFEVPHWKQPVDVSDHVAAQNAYGWTQCEGVFVPYGSSHSALILKNINFSIPKDLFRPLHKSPPDGPQESQKEQ